MTSNRKNILVVFGTRPDAVKLAPVILELTRADDRFRTTTVMTAQHRDLVAPILEFFDLRSDYDLDIMRPEQTSTGIAAEVMMKIAPIYDRESPDLVIVLGDTTSAVAAALAAFYARIPVAHVEAGLRTDDRHNPFPEEMNRRLITQLAELHFAATVGNRDRLVAEGVDPSSIFVTGNPVIDALNMIVERGGEDTPDLLADLDPGQRVVLLTTHRRENFGEPQRNIFRAINEIVETHPDVTVVFPMHPNPEVRRAADDVLTPHPRLRILPPLDYIAFVRLMARSYLILTDSGGIQEEAPALGRPVVVLRSNTERPEVVAVGNGIVAGVDRERIVRITSDLLADSRLYQEMSTPSYPFGRGNAAAEIVRILSAFRVR